MTYVRNGTVDTNAGDSDTLSVQLAKPGVAAAWWAAADLFFTAKLDRDDTDEAAVIQKFTGLGITESAAVASIAFVPFDTVEQEGVTLYCDIRGADPTTGERHTGASWTWKVNKPITKSTDPSIPIYITQPGVGVSVVVETSPATGATLVNRDTTKDIHHEVTSAAPIAALTWPLPAVATMIKGRVYSFASSQTITALTVSFAGTIRGTALTAAVADQLYAYLCISTTGSGIVRRVS